VPRFSFAYERVLGTSLELQVEAWFPHLAQRARDAALAELDRLEPLFSSFNPQSTLSQWQQTPGVPVPLPPEFLDLLSVSQFWHQKSLGAFHPGVESLTRLWKTGEVPSPEDLALVREQLAQPLWTIEGDRATLHTPCALTLNSIAKGYIIDWAASAALRVRGVSSVLLNVGGDLCLRGRREAEVGITDPFCVAENAPPLARVRLKDAALATSGGYRRGVEVGGKWHSHLLDPRTGLPVEHVVSVSALAPCATVADVLATICSVRQPDESLTLLEAFPECAVLIVTPEGERHRSACWPQD